MTWSDARRLIRVYTVCLDLLFLYLGIRLYIIYLFSLLYFSHDLSSFNFGFEPEHCTIIINRKCELSLHRVVFIVRVLEGRWNLRHESYYFDVYIYLFQWNCNITLSSSYFTISILNIRMLQLPTILDLKFEQSMLQSVHVCLNKNLKGRL